MSRRPRASGYFRTDHAQDLALIQTRTERVALAALLVALAGVPIPRFAVPARSASQVLLASVGALSLMLLTGYAGQISLGTRGPARRRRLHGRHPVQGIQAPFWITLPARPVVGALLGVVFGLPSLRLRGLYLAVSTLALHFLVVYLGGEYETKRGFSTGIVDRPADHRRLAPSASGRAWYFILLAAAAVHPAALPQSAAQHDRPGVARDPRQARLWPRRSASASPRYKLLAFVVSSAMTAVAGALFAYYRGFVSVEAFSLFLTIQYVAMIIIGGMGSLLGACSARSSSPSFPM